MCIPWPVWGGCLRISTKWKLVTKVLVVALVSDKLRQLPVVCTEDTLSAITSTPGLLFLNLKIILPLKATGLSLYKFHFHSFPLARCAKTQKHQYCWCVMCFGLFFLLIWVTLHTLCSRHKSVSRSVSTSISTIHQCGSTGLPDGTELTEGEGCKGWYRWNCCVCV